MRIFVGNLSFSAKDADVYNLFLPFGSITYVSVVMDRKGRESRGFAFLDMPDEQQAQAAIVALNTKEFLGRPLKVEESQAKPQSHSPAVAGKRRIGRRTRSYLKKRAEAGVKDPLIFKKKPKNNPMRWQKKNEGEFKAGSKKRR